MPKIKFSKQNIGYSKSRVQVFIEETAVFLVGGQPADKKALFL